MKIHSTNYSNTFIEVAEDCPAIAGEIPQEGKQKSIAVLQYEMLINSPYQYSSDDVLFTVNAIRKDIPEANWQKEREFFFSKGQACFRASPLTKRYGWGVHSDHKGRIALFGRESQKYQQFIEDSTVAKVRAMRSKRG